jgi:hypothetical protein
VVGRRDAWLRPSTQRPRFDGAPPTLIIGWNVVRYFSLFNKSYHCCICFLSFICHISDVAFPFIEKHIRSHSFSIFLIHWNTSPAIDTISAIMDALVMTQSVTEAVSQIIKQYSNSTDVVVRQYQSYIVPLSRENFLPKTKPGTSLTFLPPTADLGILNILPTEIIQEICLRLDLRSLSRTKAVNRQMLSMVDGIPEYQSVAKQSLTILKGLLAVDIGQSASCKMLYKKLNTTTCETCGGYGTHLYILKLRTVCCMCFMFR